MKDVSQDLLKRFAEIYKEVNGKYPTDEMSQMEKFLLKRFVKGEETEDSVKSLLAKGALFNSTISLEDYQKSYE